MASKENQGLQVALILFVMITIALAVTTYVYYRKAEEKVLEAIAAKDAQATAQNAMRVTDLEKQLLLHMIGFKTQPEEALTTIRAGLSADFKDYDATFNQDMALFDAGFQEKNYRNLPQYLVSAIRDRNSQVVTLSDDIAKHAQQLTSIRTQEEQKTRVAEDALNAEQQDKKQLAVAFDADRQKFTADAETIKSSTTATLTKYQGELATVKTEVAEKTKEIRQKVDTIENQMKQIDEMRDEEFSVPDGHIVRLLADGICWISLGTADGLRRQITFSVYDQDDNAVSRDVSKGKIEVLEVVDQHLARCRIVEESRNNPILPGDLIFSPSWKAGRKIHFALAGFMDLNEDGRSNRDLIRNLITLNGGVIDAEVHDDGSITGAITVGTRYLVLGAEPGGDNAKLLRAYQDMFSMAKLKGVPTIGVDELVDKLGWKGELRTVPLGTGANPEDFKTKPGDGATRGSDSMKTFRPRTPTRGTGGSAY